MEPVRKTIPVRIKRLVRERQSDHCGCRNSCGAKLPPDGKGLVEYQHWPALKTRPVNDDGTDWIPPQHDSKYIFAELKACHRRETNEGRSTATRLGSDRHSINKVKWIRGEFKGRPKTKWPKRHIVARKNPWPKKVKRP